MVRLTYTDFKSQGPAIFVDVRAPLEEVVVGVSRYGTDLLVGTELSLAAVPEHGVMPLTRG